MMSGRPKTKTQKIKSQIVLFACVLLAACTMPGPSNDPDLKAKAEKPILPKDILVRDNQDPVVSLDLRDDIMVPEALDKSDPLPDIDIQNFSAVDATAAEAFRLLLLDHNIAVSVDDNANDVRINITNYSGKLQDVAERLSETSGVFYTYNKGLLRLSKDRSFILPLPPIVDALEEMTDVIVNLGAEDAKLDKSNRMISFRANRKAYDSISVYLERMRTQKVMIVYDTFFLQVTFNDTKQIGINWNQIAKTTTSSSSSTTTTDSGSGATLADKLKNSNGLFRDIFDSGNDLGLSIANNAGNGMAFGTLFKSGSLNIDLLFDFLREQGKVETLSRPTITMMSGGKAKFEVGGKERYVSRRGVATLGDTSSGSETTLETEDAVSGLRTEITGDYSEGTVFTNIKLNVDDIIDLVKENIATKPTETQIIRLPKTANRVLETSIRVRPGDSILIAGINQTRDSNTSSGPFAWDDYFPFLRSNEKIINRSELVIILRPRIVHFKNSKPDATLAKAKDDTGSKAMPVQDVTSAPLVTPANAANILVPPNPSASMMSSVPMMVMPSSDPNIDSQMIFSPNSAPVPVAGLSGSTDNSAWAMPLQNPSAPPPIVETSTMKLSKDKDTKPLTSGDVYSKKRNQAKDKKSKESMEPKDVVESKNNPIAPPAVMPNQSAPQQNSDPLVDSFGYYGKSGQ